MSDRAIIFAQETPDSAWESVQELSMESRNLLLRAFSAASEQVPEPDDRDARSVLFICVSISSCLAAKITKMHLGPVLTFSAKLLPFLSGSGQDPNDRFLSSVSASASGGQSTHAELKGNPRPLVIWYVHLYVCLFTCWSSR